jgi:cobalt/nickel transport system permease protein
VSSKPKIPFDPRARLLLALAALLAAALLPKHRIERLATLLAVETAVLVTLWFAGALDLSLVKRTLGLAAIPALAIAPFGLLRAGHALWTIAPGLAVTSEGAVFSLGLLLAAAAAAVAAALFVATTAPGEARAALRFLGIPEETIAAGSLVRRQIALAADELARTLRAAEARGARPRGNLAFLAARGRLAQALDRAIDRGARLDRALAVRGFDGRFPDPPPRPMPARDALLAAAGGAALLAVVWVA